jgi:hypothetical protein
MSILRVDTAEGRWTAVPIQTANDSRLSLDTRGLIVFLLSKPADWQVMATALPYLLKDNNTQGGHVGRHRVRRMLKQLEKAGYLTRVRARDANGQWSWESVLRAKTETIDRKPVDGDSAGGLSADGKPVDKDKTLNNQTQIQSKKNQPTHLSAKDADARETLRYQPPFVGEHRELARGLVGSCPVSYQQSVLDEVSAMYQLGKLRGNPFGLLRRLIERVEAGSFYPTYSNRQRPKVNPRVASRSTSSLNQNESNAAIGPVSIGDVAKATLMSMRRSIGENK